MNSNEASPSGSGIKPVLLALNGLYFFGLIAAVWWASQPAARSYTESTNHAIHLPLPVLLILGYVSGAICLFVSAKPLETKARIATYLIQAGLAMCLYGGLHESIPLVAVGFIIAECAQALGFLLPKPTKELAIIAIVTLLALLIAVGCLKKTNSAATPNQNEASGARTALLLPGIKVRSMGDDYFNFVGNHLGLVLFKREFPFQVS